MVRNYKTWMQLTVSCSKLFQRYIFEIDIGSAGPKFTKSFIDVTE